MSRPKPNNDYGVMQRDLNSIDERALAAKTDREAAGDLFREVRALIGKHINGFRRFDADDLDSFTGEIFLAAVKGFDAGRAPFLAFLGFHAQRFMLDKQRTFSRPKTVFAETMARLDGTQDGDMPIAETLTSREPDPSEASTAGDLATLAAKVIREFTPREDVRAFLSRVVLEGESATAEGIAAGYSRSWGKQVYAKFVAFAQTHSRLQAYREAT